MSAAQASGLGDLPEWDLGALYAALARDVGELVAWRFAQGLLLPPIFAVRLG